jgi:hypothetical protein
MDTDKYDANVIDLLGKIQVSTSDYAETGREDNPITESNFKILGKEYAEALYG